MLFQGRKKHDAMESRLNRGIRVFALASLLLLSAVTRAAEERIALTIEAGRVGKKVNEWARKTHYNVGSGFDGIAHLKTRGISGVYEPVEALRLMLEPTGLRVLVVGERTLSVLRPEDLEETASAPPPAPPPPKRVRKVQAESPLQATPNEVTVTGTRIHDSPPVGSSNLVVTQKDFEEAGAANVHDTIRTLPSFFGGGPSEDTFEIGTEASTNSGRGVGANLRGLDASSTLVLFNGHRLAPGGSQGVFIDLMSIPLIALKQTEIMSDGASALYGADAVGGVLNFIMREGFDGNETQLNAGGFGGGRPGELQFGHLFGHTWDSGSGLFSFEYYERDALPASERAQATTDLRRFGGNDFRIFAANPATIVFGPMTWGIPDGQDGTQLTAADLIPGARNMSDRLAATDILPEQERWSVYGNLRQSLGDNVRLFGDLLLTDRRAIGRTAAAATALPVFPNNAFYVNPLGEAAPPVPIVVNYSFIDDLGPVVGDASVTTANGILGLEMDFASDWSLTATGGYALEQQDQLLSNQVDFEALRAALNDPNELTAFNPFGDGSHTNRATIESIRSRSSLDTHSRIRSLNLTASGPLFSIPGGDVKLAVGADTRDQIFEANVTAGRQPRNHVETDRDVHSVFGELYVPLVGDANSRPGLRKLDLSVAARLEEYSDFGQTTTPRFGVTWSPVSGFSLRSTWSESLRAPSLYDLNESNNVVSFLPLPNPAAPGGFAPTLVLSGGNADLLEERATSWTFGADFKPVLLPDFSLALTWFSVKFRDRIKEYSPLEFDFVNDARFSEWVTLNPTRDQKDEFCSRGAFSAALIGPCADAPVSALMDLRHHNGAYMRTNGIDLFGKYKIDTTVGQFKFGLLGTYVLDYSEAPLQSFPMESYEGTQNHPVELRLRGSTTWTRGRFTTTGIVIYSDGYRDTWSVPSRRVSSWTTLDLNLAYQFGQDGSGTRVSVNVENAFNDLPPFLNNSVGLGYDAENADLTGRIVSFRIRRNW
jgi:iron complex outermembrane receptor protein